MTWSFLIDANLPVALARAISAAGHKAVHVSDLGFEQRDDIDIWQLAGGRGEVVVSKDADFADLANLDAPGQRVVWLRMGNTRKQHLLARFQVLLPDIVAALDAGETLVEVR